MFGSEPFAGTTTERPTGMIPSGSGPWRPRARVQQAREHARRVVAHQDLHVVTAAPQRRRLVLGVLDDAAPVRPRERDDDADLHARRPAANARAPSRSAPSSIVSSLDGEREPRPAGAARAEALAGRDGDAMLRRAAARRSALRAGAARRRTCPRRPAARGARRRSRRAGARSAATRSATESCGPSSAAIVARCSGSKIPTRLWSFSRLMRSTISALPTTKPMRQPAMPYVFDIDHISTPTSFAPGVARKLCGRAPVEDEVDVRGVVHDGAAGPLAPSAPPPRRRPAARRPRTGSTGS